MSSTNRVGLRYVAEETFGTTPTSPAFIELPTTGQPNLGFAPSTVVSNLLRDDRQVSDLILVGGEAGGQANSELAFGIHDDLLAGIFFSSWQSRFARRNDRGVTEINSISSNVVSIDADAGLPTFTGTVDFSGTTDDKVTRSSGSFITDGFTPGKYVQVTGAVDGGNNATFLVTAVSALYMVLSGLPSDETADTGVTVAECPVGVNDIVRHEGFSASANNGYFVVTAATATSYTIGAGLTNDAAPATAAQSHCVGIAAGSGDVVATATPNTVTTTDLDLTSLGLEAGDWVKLSGSGGTWPAANSGWGRVASVTANLLTWDIAPTGWAANAGTSATVKFFVGERLRNGTSVDEISRTSFSLERTFSDHDPVTYQYLTGFVPDQVTITGGAQAILQSNFTFVGLGSEFTETRVSGATDIDASQFDVLNTSSNVARIARGGTVLIGAGTKNLLTEISFVINNNLRRKNAIGTLGAADVLEGEFNVSGTLNAYFDNKALAEDVVNNTETSVDMRVDDGNDHIMLFDVPRLKYSQGQPSVAGKNQDVTIQPNYQAMRDATLEYTMKLQRHFGWQ